MESEWFYYGLSSQPKLLSRSSTYQWSDRCSPDLDPQHPRPPARSVHPIINRELSQVWEDIAPKVSSLAPQTWCTMDVIHIRCEKSDESEDVVWISCPPDTCTSAQAKVCTDIIKTYLNGVPGFARFECHIKEGDFQPHVSNLIATPLTEVALPFSTSIGRPVQPLDGHRMGTMGPLVKRVDDGAVCFLTARHTALADADLKSLPRMVTFNDTTDWRLNADSTRKAAAGLARRGGSNGEKYKRIVHEVETCISMSENYDNLQLGQVCLAPPIQFAEYTLDVAVIQLDKNITEHYVWLGTKDDLEWVRCFGDDFIPPQNAKLPIAGTAECSEILGRKVLKRGARTGLTTGVVNGIFSKRRVYEKKQGLVNELCIIGDDQKPFSKKGDSGAAVVSTDGLVVGLLTGGNDALTPSADLTYVTPMSWLLEQLMGRYVILSCAWDTV